MVSKPTLPGLDRIIEVCSREGLKHEIYSPTDSPKPGEPILGSPLDPMLAAFYQRMNGAAFSHLFVYQYGRGRHKDLEMSTINEIYRRDREVVYCSSLIFARESSLAYFYAVIPGLADALGLQPVMRIEAYEDLVVLPVASNVNQFFDLYSRYLETWATSEEDVDFRPSFPWDVPELVARDTHLVEALLTGRYDSWIAHNESTDKWYEKVLAAARGARQ